MSGSERRPTIMEVAKLAGVSHQTVSRYLRFNGGLKESTLERIRSAIEELGYRPNLVARAMRSRRTGRLGILLPAGSAFSSLQVLTGMTAVAHEAGYTIEVVTVGGSSSARAQRVLELSDSGLFEGILSLTPLPIADERPGSTPIVISADYDDEMRGIGQLADATPIADIMDRLAADGHRRFLHLAGDPLHTSARLRRQVYLESIERLRLESYGVADCGWSADAARRAILALPANSGVTAVIGANDKLAAGAIRAAYERGQRIPADLSITGWDNEPLGAILAPTITTVAIDYELVGRRDLSRLLAVLRDEPVAEDNDPITEIIWRESTGPAPRKT